MDASASFLPKTARFNAANKSIFVFHTLVFGFSQKSPYLLQMLSFSHRPTQHGRVFTVGDLGGSHRSTIRRRRSVCESGLCLPRLLGSAATCSKTSNQEDGLTPGTTLPRRGHRRCETEQKPTARQTVAHRQHKKVTVPAKTETPPKLNAMVAVSIKIVRALDHRQLKLPLGHSCKHPFGSLANRKRRGESSFFRPCRLGSVLKVHS
jgi:hypothetical protein